MDPQGSVQLNLPLSFLSNKNGKSFFLYQFIFTIFNSFLIHNFKKKNFSIKAKYPTKSKGRHHSIKIRWFFSSNSPHLPLFSLNLIYCKLLFPYQISSKDLSSAAGRNNAWGVNLIGKKYPQWSRHQIHLIQRDNVCKSRDGEGKEYNSAIIEFKIRSIIGLS